MSLPITSSQLAQDSETNPTNNSLHRWYTMTHVYYSLQFCLPRIPAHSLTLIFSIWDFLRFFFQSFSSSSICKKRKVILTISVASQCLHCSNQRMPQKPSISWKILHESHGHSLNTAVNHALPPGLGLAQLCFFGGLLCYSLIPQCCPYYAFNQYLLCSNYALLCSNYDSQSDKISFKNNN